MTETSETGLLVRREWAYIGLRTALAIVVMVIIAVNKALAGTVDYGWLVWPVAAVLIASVCHAVCVLVASLHTAIAPVAALGDALMAGGLAAIAPDPLIIIFLIAMPGAAGLLRLSWVWSAGQVTALIAGVLAGLFITGGQAGLASVVTADTRLPLLMGGIAIALIIIAFVIDLQVGKQRRQIDALVQARAADQMALREHTRAIYELAYSMSDSIRYEKILQAALEAGTLGLKTGERSAGSGLVAAVMLYHADDNMLHVVAKRRFSKSDSEQTLPGKSGLIAQALKDVEPVIGGNARKDPELQYFSAFQYCRSMLIIPLHSGYDNFGVIVYGSDKADIFTDDQRDVLSAVGLLATVGLQNALLYQSLLEEKERLIEVEEEARKKLARDLHDGPTQNVSAIAMRMSYINRLMQKAPEKLPEELQKVEEIARRTTTEIRSMLFTLRPLVLESQGIGAALQQLAQKVEETHGQKVNVRTSKDIEAVLDRNQQGVIFYIVEEAINNARKHAQALLIQVTIGRQDDVVVVKVADNGRGFDMQKVNTNYDQRGSLGMINMRERAELIQGRLSIESVAGRGTVITIVIPLRKGAALPTEPISGKSGTTKIALAAAERMQRREPR